MCKGFMFISREKIDDFEWSNNPHVFYVFFKLLFKASYKDKRWEGVDIKRGQLVTGRAALSKELNLSEQVVRTCLDKLTKSGYINQQSTNRYTIITICNYDSWQTLEKTNNQQLTSESTNNQPADNHNINKENKDNIKEENNIYSDEIENLRRENEELKQSLAAANAKQEKAPKVSKTLGGRAREVWETFYNDLGISEMPYYWTAKDAGQMKNILNALRFSRTQKGLTATDDELLYALKYLLDSINDQWVLEHLSVATVYSKFNDIVAGAKAARKKSEADLFSQQEEEEHRPKVLVINGVAYR